MSAHAAIALITALVGVPAGSTAPPAGSVPAAAHVQVLDRQLGILAVQLPRRGSVRALARLRRAPGVRYATVSSPSAGGLAAPCLAADHALDAGSAAWRSAIHLTAHSAAGFTVGIADTGADLSRLGGVRDRLLEKNFSSGSTGDVSDQVGHGTDVASLIGANRPDLGVRGVAPDVGLAIARITNAGLCRDTTILQKNLVVAFNWFRSQGDVQIVNVSANVQPTPALIESLRALQQAGTLVVAATGDVANPGKATFPAGQPHVLGVGALAEHSKTRIWSLSGRGADVDLVAPAAGSGVVESGSLAGGDLRAGLTQEGTSFSAPIVSGAAALVWAKHPAWDASRVAAALMQSASRMPGARPNPKSGWGRLNVAAAIKASPPADLDEPNDWASAVRTLRPLPVGTTLGASVGGDDDPLDGYPVEVTRRSHVSVTAQGDVTVSLLASSAIDEIGRSAKAAASHAVKTGDGSSVRLAIPHGGEWAVVVTAKGSRPTRYSLRVG